jgi:hypothetical protein
MNIKTHSTEIVPVFCMAVNPDLSYWGRTFTEDIRDQGAEEDIWTKEGESKRWMGNST